MRIRRAIWFSRSAWVFHPSLRLVVRLVFDVGVKDFLTLSTGEKINYPDRLHQLEERVRWE